MRVSSGLEGSAPGQLDDVDVPAHQKPQNPQKTPKSSKNPKISHLCQLDDVDVPAHPRVNKLGRLHKPNHILVGPLARAQNDIPDLGCSGFWFRYRTISPTWDLRLEVQDQGFGILLSMDLDVCNDKN